MFRDNFKKELSQIKADEDLLSRTRKLAAQKNGRSSLQLPSYARRSRYLRIAAAAVCSLIVLAAAGIFIAMRTGFDFSDRLSTAAGQQGETQSPAFSDGEKADGLVPGTSDSSSESAGTDTQPVNSSNPEITDPPQPSHGTKNDFNDAGIYSFADYESILTILEKSWANANNGYGWSGEIMPELGLPDTATDGTQAAGETIAKDTAANPGNSDFSQTNVQVEGVDEADIIKNDGEFIYCILNASLYVLDVRDPQNMKVAAVISDNFSLANDYANYLDLFYDSTSNTLSVISNAYYASPDIAYPDIPAEPPVISEGGISADQYYGMYPMSSYTKLQTYDVSNPYNPKEIRTFFQEGSYVSSRRIDDTVYLVTSQGLWYDGVMKAEDIMPSTSDGDDNWVTIPAPDIYIVNPDYANTFTVVSAVDSRRVDVAAKTQAVVGQGTVVYASTDTLYIAATIWDETIYRTYQDFSAAESEGNMAASAENDVYKTKLLSFRITDGTLEAKASGSVNGTLLNQYSMDEYQGNLRIATTSGGWTANTSNNVFVLDENLDLISGLTELAPGEQIYSARFAGDRIYLVTFRQVDPFFVIDASDPANLTVLGKLKIPGYSNYLHMLSDNKVLAIGNATYTNGGSVIPAGLKIAVFDVTDPADPVLESSVVYGQSYGYSEVQYNPKALLLNQQRGLIGLPVSFDMPSGDYGTDYVNGYLLLHFDDNGKLAHEYLFKDIDSILNYGMCRGIYIDDTIYLIGYTEVLAYSLDTFNLTGTLSLYQN